MRSDAERSVVRFGVFEMDLDARELRKSGVRVKLQDQPFRVLALLVERPGEIVTREEIREAIWAEDTFVEFDHGLNTVVQKIRQALGDSATSARFLETLPRRGYRFVGTVEAAQPPVTEPSSVGKTREREVQRLRGQRAVLLGLAAFLAFCVFWLAFDGRGQSETPAPYRRFGIELGRSISDPKISPDGGTIAYFRVSRPKFSLWVRRLDDDQPRLLVHADELGDYVSQSDGPTLFWSPDSQSIGIRTIDGVVRAAVESGRVTRIAKQLGYSVLGSSWSPDGELVVFVAFAQNRIYGAPARGGEAELIIEGPARYPHFLPEEAGTRVLLYAVNSADRADSGPMIVVHDLSTDRKEELLPGTRPVYSPSGHILFAPSDQAGGTPELWAVPFSVQELQLSGEPFVVEEGAELSSVAADGTLVYLDVRGSQREQLTWRDRQGRTLGRIGQPQLRISQPMLSPDDSAVAVSGTLEWGEREIWIHDTERPTARPLTDDENCERPTWSPDGNEVVYSSAHQPGAADLYRIRVDGRESAERILQAPLGQWPFDWSLSPERVVYTTRNEKRVGSDIYYLERGDNGEHSAYPFVETEADELSADLSPDGRFLAYESNESGRFEVYVAAFPSGSPTTPVSTNGGRQPRWRGDGRELFYVSGSSLTAVAIDLGTEISVGEPEALFDGGGVFDGRGHEYDVSSDGERFVVVEPLDAAAPPVLRVVQNWFAPFAEREVR